MTERAHARRRVFKLGSAYKLIISPFTQSGCCFSGEQTSQPMTWLQFPEEGQCLRAVEQKLLVFCQEKRKTMTALGGLRNVKRDVHGLAKGWRRRRKGRVAIVVEDNNN